MTPLVGFEQLDPFPRHELFSLRAKRDTHVHGFAFRSLHRIRSSSVHRRRHTRLGESIMEIWTHRERERERDRKTKMQRQQGKSQGVYSSQRQKGRNRINSRADMNMHSSSQFSQAVISAEHRERKGTAVLARSKNNQAPGR